MMKIVMRQVAIDTKNLKLLDLGLKELVAYLHQDDVAQEFKFNGHDHIFLSTTKYKDGECVKDYKSTFCATTCTQNKPLEVLQH